ncbi:hypothetical protein IH785_13200 [candidate division KSB1 bacterium]|nr:hypothetical protein [candidate division KSB1 bacterium]
MSSANSSNVGAEVDREVEAITAVETDHPGTRGAVFVGSPNPSLRFVKEGVDM